MPEEGQPAGQQSAAAAAAARSEEERLKTKEWMERIERRSGPVGFNYARMVRGGGLPARQQALARARLLSWLTELHHHTRLTTPKLLPPPLCRSGPSLWRPPSR